MTARRSSTYFDALRAKALQGDRLRDLADAEREWVWRSLLKGVRRAEAVRLAGLRADQVDPAVAQIRRLYQQRIDHYKAQPQVVRPIPAPAAPRPRFFGWLRRSS